MRGILDVMEEKQGDVPEGTKAKTPSPTEHARQDIDERQRIEGLRERLYARGTEAEHRGRSALLSDAVLQRPRDVSHEARHDSSPRIHEDIQAPPAVQPVLVREATPIPTPAHDEVLPPEPQVEAPTPLMTLVKKKSYRVKIVLGGLIFFVLAVLVSSFFLMFGGNTISGDNITLSVSGPFAVGGGSEIPIQVAISNQNTIPIEAATLIVTYPRGTQSAKEPGKELINDRQQLNNIESGFVQNIPLRAIVFGEENEEKMINVSIEYRVRGSNAIFTKAAEPLRFKISSSPVVLLVDSVKKISSGQEVEIVLTVGSNSPSPLSDVLVKAVYPSDFDFSESKPDANSGKDVWVISELKPNEKKEITITGTVIGKQDEEKIFSFSVGVPNERDRFNLASVFTSATAGITVEDPFLGVGVTVGGSTDDTVSVFPGESVTVDIRLTNTLSDTLYDGVITAELSGNALDELKVDAGSDGFYDSTENKVSWEFVENDDLAKIQPGQSRSVSFTLTPNERIGQTPEVKLTVTAKGKRVYENEVPQELIGTASRVVKVASDVAVQTSALYSEGPFTNTGPVPPIAESVTQYTYLLTAKNGSNDVTGAELTATMPAYITWLDLVSSGDVVTYDAVNRTLKWAIGDIDANAYEEAWVQVSFRPSLSQVGSTPTILGTQYFKATDRFTGTVIRRESPALTTALMSDPNEATRDGVVQKSE